MKQIVLRCLFFVRCPPLGYPESDESYESDKEESNELGSESGSYGTFSNGLGGLLYGVGFTVGMKLTVDDFSCYGDGRSLDP